MRIVSLEGNIGAGKSTLLSQVRLPEGWVALEEPVSVWDSFRDKEGKTMLEKFYEFPQTYAFAFQIMAYTTRRAALEALMAQQPAGILCERSLAADHEIFAKMLRDVGCLEPVLYDIYAREAARSPLPLDAILYLDVPVETCVARVAKRGREGEAGVEFEYLNRCALYHSEWLARTDIPVFYVKDGNDMAEQVHQRLLGLFG
jgi:deoxyadenosine/deoxycytidine kinase